VNLTDPSVLTALALALAALASCARLLWRRVRGEAARDAAFLLQLAAPPALAALLYLGLHPPAVPVPDATLVVYTESAEAAPEADGRMRVALPEAPTGLDAERVPDLATALRRHPEAVALQVRGDGLPARDREAAAGRRIDFRPSDAPRGVVELALPNAATLGGPIEFSGRVQGVAGAALELLDPAGQRVDRSLADPAGRFRLTAPARAAGAVEFGLRLLDADEVERERLALPIWVQAPAPLRLWIQAGAPGAELKYLRRWASDTGAALHSRVAAGAGLSLGDAPRPLTPAALREHDALILDARSFEALSDAQFEAIDTALQQGLGVLLRLDLPPSARSRARLRRWGLAPEGEGEVGAVHLGGPDADLPVLSGLRLAPAGEDAAPLRADADSPILGYWRARGRGRVGFVTLIDSYRLVLAGAPQRHGALWSRILGTLARATSAAPDAFTGGLSWVGERIELCGLADGARLRTPEGATLGLEVDPATGARRCAAYWPTQAGWYRLSANDDAEARPFAVFPNDSGHALRAEARRSATSALAASAARRPEPSTAAHRPGSPWPWLGVWLALATLVWWLERRQRGRG